MNDPGRPDDPRRPSARPEDEPSPYTGVQYSLDVPTPRAVPPVARPRYEPPTPPRPVVLPASRPRGGAAVGLVIVGLVVVLVIVGTVVFMNRPTPSGPTDDHSSVHIGIVSPVARLPDDADGHEPDRDPEPRPDTLRCRHSIAAEPRRGLTAQADASIIESIRPTTGPRDTANGNVQRSEVHQ